jgi:hypothetical protein
MGFLKCRRAGKWALPQTSFHFLFLFRFLFSPISFCLLLFGTSTIPWTVHGLALIGGCLLCLFVQDWHEDAGTIDVAVEPISQDPASRDPPVDKTQIANNVDNRI